MLSITTNRGIYLKIIIEDLLKRSLDSVVSVLCLIILFPLFLAIAFLVKISSKGPVLFLQKRCSKDGIEFDMYKFRTMVKDAESWKKKLKNEVDGPMFKIKDDPRTTPIGKILRKLHLDELPQFVNVLKGEMSLVGPRPLADEEMKGDEFWKETRLSVKPGMTGLWQVKGRGSQRFSDWIKYDIEYAKERSFGQDIKILFLTPISILTKG